MQGIAFSDIPEGTYYPTVSLFTLPLGSGGGGGGGSGSGSGSGAAAAQAGPARVRLNFGPSFAYPPPIVGPAVEVGWCGARAGGGDDGPRLPRPRPACELAGDPPDKGGGK